MFDAVEYETMREDRLSRPDSRFLIPVRLVAH